MNTDYFYMFDNIEKYMETLDSGSNKREFDALEAIDMFNSSVNDEHPLVSEFKDMRENKYVVAAAVLDYWWAIKYAGEKTRNDPEIVESAVECFKAGLNPKYYEEYTETIKNFMQKADNMQIAKLQQLTDDGITHKDACELLMNPSVSYKQMDIIANAFLKENPPAISVDDYDIEMSFESYSDRNKSNDDKSDRNNDEEVL